MILFDGIIFKLQKMGGVSVLFKEIIARLPSDSYQLLSYIKESSGSKQDNFKFQSPRICERYRRVIFKEKIDVFHSTYYRLPKKKSCKVIMSVYDYTYERYVPGFRKTIHSWQKNKAISESDKIICISESTRNDLIKYSGDIYSERSTVIHCGVSEDYYPISGINVLPQVLFVGARSGYKNFKAVIFALIKLKDLNLVCVGGGDFTHEERRLLDKFLPGRYSCLAYLKNSELNQVYNQSLCLVYPSLYEGFGIPIVEAMRAGCPVIAVNCSSIPEVAGNAAVLIEKGEPDEIKDAISVLMDDVKRKSMIEKGYKQSKKFSWDKTFEDTLKVYNEL